MYAMLLTQSSVSPIISLIIVAVLAANLRSQLRTGKVRVHAGAPIYRKDNARLFWFSVACGFAFLALFVILFFTSVSHLFP